MSKGIIKYGFFNGNLVIHVIKQAKFIEAISLKKYFKEIEDYTNLIFYFENVKLIDSTFIGTLLYMGLENNKKNNKKGIIYCDEYIKKTVSKYGILKIFEVYTEAKTFENILFKSVNIENPSEKEILKELIENHKVLSSFSEENKKEFETLLRILESEYEKKEGL